jgi:hypothetical protein
MNLIPIRVPGFRYAPTTRTARFDGRDFYCVRQAGFWMYQSLQGPYKPTLAEAIKAWNKLARRLGAEPKQKKARKP